MQPIKLGLIGASGRMGTAILSLLGSTYDFVLSSAIVAKDDNLCGEKTINGITFSSDLETAAQNSDILIDFSVPQNTLATLSVAKKHHIPLVCGVTGLSDATSSTMKEISSEIKIFYASNMSMGIAIMKQAVALFTQKLGNDFDIEVNEMHHAKKIDAPSGTALDLGKTIAAIKNWDPEHAFCFQRTQQRAERSSDQIGFSVIRGGSCSGTHTVLFLGENESISITHQAQSRIIFAKGALQAAHWLIKQPNNGLYAMDDLINSI